MMSVIRGGVWLPSGVGKWNNNESGRFSYLFEQIILSALTPKEDLNDDDSAASQSQVFDSQNEAEFSIPVRSHVGRSRLIYTAKRYH